MAHPYGYLFLIIPNLSIVLNQTQRRAAWTLTAALALLYLLGFFLGWASAYASWHLLLVIVAILFLFSALSSRGA